MQSAAFFGYGLGDDLCMGISCGEVLGCVREMRTVVADAAAVSNVGWQTKTLSG